MVNKKNPSRSDYFRSPPTSSSLRARIVAGHENVEKWKLLLTIARSDYDATHHS